MLRYADTRVSQPIDSLYSYMYKPLKPSSTCWCNIDNNDNDNNHIIITFTNNNNNNKNRSNLLFFKDKKCISHLTSRLN